MLNISTLLLNIISIFDLILFCGFKILYIYIVLYVLYEKKNSYRMGLKLEQSLVGYLVSLCFNYIHAHLSGNTNFWLKLCEKIDALLLPLEVLPSYKRWPPYSLYPS